MRMLKLLASALLSFTLTAPALAQDRAADRSYNIEQGHSIIEGSGRTIKQIILGDPNVISADPLSPTQVRIKGIEVGTTNLLIVYADAPSQPVEFSITVQQDLSQLITQIDNIIGDGGEAPQAYPINGRLVVEGTVPSVQKLEQVAAVAGLFDEDFVNLMTVGGDHQVQLQVVFAEVSRSGMRQLGLNTIYGDNFLGIGMLSPGQTELTAISRAAVNSLNGGITPATSADSFNLLGIFESPINVTSVLSVLEQNGVSQTLAQPTLTALSGQQAEFLVGGEVPIPVAQFGSRITIDFREYGVKMTFVPTVLGGDVIDVRVYMEVSDIDNVNSVQLTGIEIPAFTSRKSSSHLRVESGKTFAMAGMLQESSRSTIQKVPILGDIPVLGALFRSVEHARDETELMIFVTPRLVRPLSPEEVPAPPGTTQDYNPNDFELFLLGLDHKVGSRTAEPTGPIGLER